MAKVLAPSVKSWQRIGRVVQDVEGAPLQAIRRRARWPISGGSKPKRVYITQDNGSGEPAAVFRDAFPDGFECSDNRDGSDPFTVFMDTANAGGVFFTGQWIEVERFRLDDQNALARWHVVASGPDQWNATAGTDIASTGDAVIKYWNDADGDNDECTVEAELFNILSPITGGQSCWVMFHEDLAGLGQIAASRFVAIPRNCPDYSTVV